MDHLQVMEHNLIEELPKDEHNLRRLHNTHPENWDNPEPQPFYNIVVIGGGSGGLLTAIVAANLGAKVALIEKNLMGGDCLNVGCVPSKAIIRSAKVMGQIIHGEKFGVTAEGVSVDFKTVMTRIRKAQADISRVDSVWRYTEEGVDVFLGAGRFSGPETIEVDGKQLKFKKAVIATGSRPYVPPVDGLAEVGYLTNESVWNLEAQPRRLAVIGGGPIGSELAQAFQRLGTEVTLLHNSDHILNKEDADAAEIVQQSLLADGVKLVLDNTITRVEQLNGEKILHFECPVESGTLAVDEILVATGRTPNIENLGLEHVGVKTDSRRGILVNDFLQTDNPDIYAIGDVAMAYKFTHAAAAAGKIVIQNALFYGRKKVSDLIMPWVTYTEPEIAHVGLYEHDAEEQGIEVDTFTVHFDDNDRAIADGEEAGFVKVHVKKGTDEILGATIVGHNAGDMISEITLAMVGKIGLKTLGDVIHPYPTLSETIAKVASAYNKTRLTPTVQKLFSGWMTINRKI